jgi:hypothetical protein
MSLSLGAFLTPEIDRNLDLSEKPVINASLMSIIHLVTRRSENNENFDD